MNLSKYAGLFILIIIVGVVVLMLVANVINRSAGKVFIISLVGSFIGIWIVDILNFEDASLETVVTIMVSVLLPSCLFVFNCGIQYVNEMHKKKSYVLKEAIIEKLESKKKELVIEKTQFEKQLAINNSVNNLMILLQLCASTKMEFEKNDKIYEYSERRHIVLKAINDRDQEILAIDDQIRNIKLETDYFKLLQAEKGDK
jgi:hypothetical protein